MKLCTDCRYCLLQKEGYSNYTVEGETVHCLLEKQEPFDRWYGEDERLRFAETCDTFSLGECLEEDVENAVGYPDSIKDEEIKQLYIKCFGD